MNLALERRRNQDVAVIREQFGVADWSCIRKADDAARLVLVPLHRVRVQAVLAADTAARIADSDDLAAVAMKEPSGDTAGIAVTLHSHA